MMTSFGPAEVPMGFLFVDTHFVYQKILNQVA